MKLIALMLIRNESWVLDFSLDAVLRWVDGVVILDHASTDDTPGIITEFTKGVPGRIKCVRDDTADDWKEMIQRQRLLEMGRDVGGTHFALVDADEVVTHNNIPNMRYWIEALKPGEALELPMIAPWDSLDRYRADDSVWSRSILSMAFADKPGMSWAPRGEEKYQHHNRVPHGYGKTVHPACEGGVFHLQWCDWDRVISKHRRYTVLERLNYPTYSVDHINAKYSEAIQDRAVTTKPIPDKWWGDYPKSDIVIGQEPWHDADTRRMLGLRPPPYWNGVDLRGWEAPCPK